MDDGEQDSARAVISNDPRIIIATTVAAFFFAGSAYMWRSLPKSVLASSHQRDSDVAKNEGTSSTAHGTGVTAANVNGGGESEGLSVDSKDAKNARSKERRRRGKDPTKELLKNVKKSKSFLKPTKPTIDLPETPESPPPLAKSFREQTGIARERAQDSSGHSRSLSRASVDGRPHHSANVESDGSDRPRTQDTTEHEDSPFLNTTPTASRSLYFGTDNAEDVFTIATSSESPCLVASSTQESTATTRPSDYPTISLSASSSTSNSGSILSSTSNLTPNTSPTLSPSWKDVTPLPRPPPPANTSSSTLLPKNMSESTSLPAVSESGSWDWDGAGPSTVHEHLPSRKPPRFRSKSRGGSGSITMSPSIPESAMLTRFSEFSDSGPGSSTSSQSVDQLPEFVFPSLSALSGTSVPSPMSPTTNRAGPGAASSSGSVPRRAPTPGRRPPTPRSSTNTPPPSLSAQTQLASLRGALEASRIREEKQKLDIEKVNKELEVARYEWAASRSRELDLQNQIHQLAHQMQQMYATMAGSTPKPANSTTSTGTPSGNGSDSTTSQSTSDTSTPNAQPNGFQFPPPPAAGNPQTPSHLHMSPAQMQMYLPSGLLSPLAMSHTAPHSPFHPYPYSPMAGMPSPYHYASPSPMFPSLYSSMNGLDSNGGRSAGDSGPSSTAGSSSAGSHSPDLSMLGSRIMSSSSTPPPGSSSIQSRGRGRSRRSGSGEAGEQNGVGEGLSALDDQLMGDALATFGAGKLSRRSPFPLEENHDDDDSDVNNVLADAILKRPGSIRGLSRRKKSDKDMSKDNVEFVFPSLSNLGNVNASRGDITPEETAVELVSQGEEIQEIAAPEPQDISKVVMPAVDAPLDDSAEETTPPAVNGAEESLRTEAPQEAA